MSDAEPLFDEYFVWLTVEKGRSRATIQAYRRDLAQFGVWASEQRLALADVAPGEIDHYLVMLHDQG
ncbi:MAG: site-specific integrase, partial [Actinomycetota bacterium]|nr:site-specific integrase [Actinomycetota bacterium]